MSVLFFITCTANTFLASVAVADEIKIHISKETTYVTQPRTSDGFVDLAAAINVQLSDGVTQANNAAAALYFWAGPKPEGTRLNPDFYAELGIPVPPEQGTYFRPFGDFLSEQGLRSGSAEEETLIEQLGMAQNRPWTPGEFPTIAAWLDGQKKPLAEIVSGLDRPNYFCPVVPEAPGEAGQGLIATLLPHLQLIRSMGRALTARAMLHLGQGQNAEAWNDIVSTMRLGRHVGHGASAIDRLVGSAVEEMGCRAALTFVAERQLDRRSAGDAIKKLNDLPSPAAFADAVALTERLAFIDVVMMLHLDIGERSEALGIEDGLMEMKRVLQMPSTPEIDWNETLRVGNEMYDELAEAMSQNKYDVRQEALEQIRQKLSRVQNVRWLREQFKNNADRPKKLGVAAGQILVTLLVPGLTQIGVVEFRSRQSLTNVKTALALAAFRADHHVWPESLDALTPGYLPRIPLDHFSGRPLIYQRTGNVCRFYSVGPNGEDDEGATVEQGEDDLLVSLSAE